MTRHVADAVRAFPTIVINDTFRLAPWAGLLYAADAAWWAANPDAHAFAGLKVTVDSVPGIEQLRNTGAHGFDHHPTCIRTGSNSGYQGVHIAAQAGASRILLLGFDMTAVRGAHWFGPHGHGLVNTAPETYARFIRRFEELKIVLDSMGIDVVNCTPGSALDCFRRSTIEQELSNASGTFASERLAALPR